MCKIILGVFTLVIVAMPAAARPDTWTLADITAAYIKKYEQIKTIRVDSSKTVNPVIPRAELFRKFRVETLFPITTMFVSHRDGRFRYERADPISETVLNAMIERLAVKYPEVREPGDALWRVVPYDQYRAVAETERRKHPEPSIHVRVYDGQKLWEFQPDVHLTMADGVARRAFEVVNPARLQRGYLPRSVLDDQLFSFAIPGLPSTEEDRRKDRLPSLFDGGGFRLLDRREAVDGVECLVAGNPDQGRLYFDPELAFALRKRQWYLGGQLIYGFVAGDFEKLAENLWFPRTLVYTQYGPKSDEQYSGKPLHREVVHVTKLELNNPEHLKYFTVNVPPGSWVTNETLTPLDAKGQPASFPKLTSNEIPSVSYIQPADPKDLEKVVADARQDAGARSPELVGGFRGLLVWFTIGMVAAVTLAVAYRRLAARRPPSGEGHPG